MRAPSMPTRPAERPRPSAAASVQSRGRPCEVSAKRQKPYDHCLNSYKEKVFFCYRDASFVSFDETEWHRGPAVTINRSRNLHFASSVTGEVTTRNTRSTNPVLE